MQSKPKRAVLPPLTFSITLAGPVLVAAEAISNAPVDYGTLLAQMSAALAEAKQRGILPTEFDKDVLTCAETFASAQATCKRIMADHMRHAGVIPPKSAPKAGGA